MTTEQYSIGYDAGYQDGFDAALTEPVKQEPVAWRNAIKHWAFDCAWGDLSERQIDDLELLVTGVLNAAPVDAKAIRAEALEEAAKVCEEYALESMEAFNRTGHDFEDRQVNGGYGCAAAIRGLK